MEFTIDIHDVISVHIDKKKKFPASALLRAVGYSRDADILSLFFERETVSLAALERDAAREGRRGELFQGFLAEDVPDPARLGENGPLLFREILLPETGELFERGRHLTPESYAALRGAGIASFPIAPSDLLAQAGEELSAELIGRLQRAGVEDVAAFRPGGHGGSALRATLAKDPTSGTLDSLFAIHNLLRPGTAPQPEVWAEDEFFAAGEKVLHIGDFLRLWNDAENQVVVDTNLREPQRSAEDRMLRFAQERGIRYVWESFREDRAEKTRSTRVLVYELSRLLTVYTAVWRLLFQPRISLSVTSELTGGRSTARTDYGEYSVETLNKRYDLGRVGRYKINQRLQRAFTSLGFVSPPAGMTALTAQDVLAILHQLVELHDGHGETDDIDHLGNRRVRSVGELIANQFSVGLRRMARLVRERMSIITDPDKIKLDDLVNARTVSAVIQAFFGSRSCRSSWIRRTRSPS